LCTVAAGDNVSLFEVCTTTGSRINGTVSNTVTLGSANYGSPLSVTANGVVAPTGNGAVGLYSDLPGGMLTNRGMINGGYGSGANVTNVGIITGGSASPTTYIAYKSPGRGGAGVALSSASQLVNSGMITGGAGIAYKGAYTVGTAGGAGATFDGAHRVNSGTIGGGEGGSTGGTYFAGGAGGVGIVLNGGVVTNAGTIAGGIGGTAVGGNGAMGDAVQFGTIASTLVVDPGAVFIGNVVANATVHDVLDLPGSAPGTLTGLGHPVSPVP
jgi:hypothetical protein